MPGHTKAEKKKKRGSPHDRMFEAQIGKKGKKGKK